MAEIARRAGISKGVISYHFAGKRELIEQVVNSVLEKGERRDAFPDFRRAARRGNAARVHREQP